MVERVASCVKSDLLTLQTLNTILYKATDSLGETQPFQASRLSDDVFSKEAPPLHHLPWPVAEVHVRS